MTAGSRRSSAIWAITSYFNPGGFRTRRENYERFRSHLSLPLLTIELDGWRGFDLVDEQADILIQIDRGDLLWQKERLLNLALEHLPASCTAIAWLDCDVLFANADWADGVESAISRHGLVQLFDRLVHLGPGERPGASLSIPPESVRRSFASAWTAGDLPADFFRRPETSANTRCNCGMAWAASRALVERSGFYDTMVLGMGDKHMAAAAVGRVEDAVECLEMSAAHGDHYRRWAERFQSETGGSLGHVPGTLYHLWHGDLADRRYVARYQGFRSFAFDPESDLALNRDGAWRWASAKTALHQHVADYFQSRREDGRGTLDGHALLAEHR